MDRSRLSSPRSGIEDLRSVVDCVGALGVDLDSVDKGECDGLEGLSEDAIACATRSRSDMSDMMC